MAASNSGALALADHLRTLGDRELTGVLRARAVRDQGISDFFDLADRLLAPASISECLATLSRPTLTTLAVVAELTAAGDGSGILSLSEVDARLTTLGIQTPGTTAPGTTAHIATAHIATAVSLGLAEAAASGHVQVYSPVIDVILSWPSVGLPSAAELAQSHPAALEVVTDHDRTAVDGRAASS